MRFPKQNTPRLRRSACGMTLSRSLVRAQYRPFHVPKNKALGHVRPDGQSRRNVFPGDSPQGIPERRHHASPVCPRFATRPDSPASGSASGSTLADPTPPTFTQSTSEPSPSGATPDAPPWPEPAPTASNSRRSTANTSRPSKRHRLCLAPGWLPRIPQGGTGAAMPARSDLPSSKSGGRRWCVKA